MTKYKSVNKYIKINNDKLYKYNLTTNYVQINLRTNFIQINLTIKYMKFDLVTKYINIKT